MRGFFVVQRKDDKDEEIPCEGCKGFQFRLRNRHIM